MQFFLYEVLARVVAIYFCFDCCRALWSGLVERKIAYSLATGSILDSFFPAPRNWIFERDSEPMWYWTTIGMRIVCAFACFGVAILGWFHPDS